LYGALDESNKVAYRLNALMKMQEVSANVKSDRIYFNPSFCLKVGNKTEVVLEAIT